MQALILIACSLTIALQFWTSYLLRERSPTITGVWKAAHIVGNVAFYSLCIAFVALPTFPK
jgi:hypothetical protein